MQEWEWIEEPRYAEDFEHLFDGENRNCNIRWIGKPLVILTELTKRLLKQSYMDEQKGVSASSIVQKQFGKTVVAIPTDWMRMQRSKSTLFYIF